MILDMSREYTKEQLWSLADSDWKYTLSTDKKKYLKNLKLFYKRVVSRAIRGWAFLDTDAMEKMLEGWKPK